MKFALKFSLALAVGIVCIYLVARKMDGHATWQALQNLSLSAVLLYIATLAVTHLFRAWRWEYLLRPIGVSLPLRELIPLSSVGFMAILALPVRLGEFVRPYLVVRSGRARMSVVLGTVAVERIVDGLLISLLFFGCYLVSPPGSYSPELRFAAWLSLLGFVTLTLFLALALRWTDATIRAVLTLSLVTRLAPHLAHRIDDKLRALIRGFRVLHDPGNLVRFLFQSVLYWGSNGLGMWILARSLGLPISVVAAFATMAFTGVLISLPNSPGLVGQFHLGVVAGLGAYLPAAAVNSTGVAYAVVLHGIQTCWYVGTGLISLLAVRGGASSLRTMVRESNQAAEAADTGVDPV